MTASSGVSLGLLSSTRAAAVVALALAGSAPNAYSAKLEGVARVLDGDTIEVASVRVRLEGLHCPEGNEPGGRAATSAMRGLTAAQHVSCSLTSERSHERMIGTCNVGDTDLTPRSSARVRAPAAPRYDRSERYLPAQREAEAWPGK